LAELLGCCGDDDAVMADAPLSRCHAQRAQTWAG
jgi:hypothetical protein